jgi:hypothetical protein
VTAQAGGGDRRGPDGDATDPHHGTNPLGGELTTKRKKLNAKAGCHLNCGLHDGGDWASEGVRK